MFESIDEVRERLAGQSYWGCCSLGSCNMHLYEPLCDRVETVRTVEQLSVVAEELVKIRKGRA